MNQEQQNRKAHPGSADTQGLGGSTVLCAPILQGEYCKTQRALLKKTPSQGDTEEAINAKCKRFNEPTSQGCPAHEGEATMEGHYRQYLYVLEVRVTSVNCSLNSLTNIY